MANPSFTLMREQAATTAFTICDSSSHRLPASFMGSLRKTKSSAVAPHETPHPNGLASAHSFRDTPATSLFAYTGKERTARRCIRAKTMTIGPRSSSVLGS